MNLDIRISTQFFQHHKTLKLKKRLGAEGLVALLRLWVWAAQNRPDGALGNMNIEDVEIVSGWEGEEGAFASALLDLRWLDSESKSADHLRLHNWKERQPYAAAVAERAETARNRSERNKKAALSRWGKNDQNSPCGCETDASGCIGMHTHANASDMHMQKHASDASCIGCIEMHMPPDPDPDPCTRTPDQDDHDHSDHSDQVTPDLSTPDQGTPDQGTPDQGNQNDHVTPVQDPDLFFDQNSPAADDPDLIILPGEKNDHRGTPPTGSVPRGSSPDTTDIPDASASGSLSPDSLSPFEDDAPSPQPTPSSQASTFQKKETGGPGNTPPSPARKKTPKPARKKPDCERAEDFVQWWSAYPNKVGKQAAIQEWNARCRAGSLPPLPALFAALDWQRRLPNWQDPQFIPHPRTYLHQERWQDEPPAARPGSFQSFPGSRPDPNSLTLQNLQTAARVLARRQEEKSQHETK